MTASLYPELHSQQEECHAQTQFITGMRVPRSLDGWHCHISEFPFKHAVPKLEPTLHSRLLSGLPHKKERPIAEHAQFLSVSSCAPTQASLFCRKPREQGTTYASLGQKMMFTQSLCKINGETETQESCTTIIHPPSLHSHRGWHLPSCSQRNHL